MRDPCQGWDRTARAYIRMSRSLSWGKRVKFDSSRMEGGELWAAMEAAIWEMVRTVMMQAATAFSSTRTTYHSHLLPISVGCKAADGRGLGLGRLQSKRGGRLSLPIQPRTRPRLERRLGPKPHHVCPTPGTVDT